MAYRIEGLQGLVGVLIARRAASAEKQTQKQQKEFYNAVDQLLLEVQFRKICFDARWAEKSAVICRSSAKALLQDAKINSEGSDPQTLRCLEVLSHVSQDADSLFACAGALATFNGRAFSSMFLQLVRTAREGPSAVHVDGLIGKFLNALPKDQWFAASFDKRTYNSHSKRAIANRRRQEDCVFERKRISRVPRGGRQCLARDVAVLLSQELSLLNARNAMALLELNFLQRNESGGMPSFVTGHGSLMGPGALAASNLLSSELKGHNISLGTRGCPTQLSEVDDRDEKDSSDVCCRANALEKTPRARFGTVCSGISWCRRVMKVFL